MKHRLIMLILTGALIASIQAVFASPVQTRDVEQAGEWSGRTGAGVRP